MTRGELRVLNDAERRAIDRLWSRKLEQDKQGLPQSERHRNLEPDSAEFIHSLARRLRSSIPLGDQRGERASQLVGPLRRFLEEACGQQGPGCRAYGAPEAE